MAKLRNEYKELQCAPDDVVFREVTKVEEKALRTRYQKCRTRLLAQVPFFGHLALNFKMKVATPEQRVDTAGICPDGTLILNYVYIMGDQKTGYPGFTDSQFCALLCHEVMHPALFCWMRQGSRRAIVSGPDRILTLPDGTKKKSPGPQYSLWNIAHDLSFDSMIAELAESSKASKHIDGKGVLLVEPKWKKMSAEEIYDALLQEAQKNGKKDGSGKGNTIGTLTKMPGDGNGPGNDLRPDLSETKDGKKAAKGDKAAQDKLERKWKVQLVAAAQVHKREKKSKGNLPMGLQKLIDEILEPRIDWRDVLANWIGENGRREDYTYRRRSRRSESVGEFMPGRVRFGVDDVCVLWDTSGSMNGREGEILGDVEAICEDLGIGVRVICIDTQIHSDVIGIHDALDLIPHIKGGGGSDFTPAFDKLEKENYTGVLVAFTDGYITVPRNKPPRIKSVMWCLADSDVDPTKGSWGEVLKMEEHREGVLSGH